jgi:hypothetical protein
VKAGLDTSLFKKKVFSEPQISDWQEKEAFMGGK